MPLSRTLRLAVRFSLREMRGGLSGFLIFLACIALGVAAIGGVNSVARSITAGVANQGQTLLGGDLRFQINQRDASQAERSFLDGLGTVSRTASMRSMARLADGSDQALVEAKASTMPIRSMARWRPSRRCRNRNCSAKSSASSVRQRPIFCSSGCTSSLATG